MKKNNPPSAQITLNRRASFQYFLEDHFEAGMVLEGWEVKSIRAGKVQITDGFVSIREGAAYAMGCHITPLNTASSHVEVHPLRSRKLLLHKQEIQRLIGKVEQKGYTLILTNLHWKNGRIKANIALAKGKATHDKRNSIKEREGSREIARVMKTRKNG